jgi:hypothetical protein
MEALSPPPGAGDGSARFSSASPFGGAHVGVPSPRQPGPLYLFGSRGNFALAGNWPPTRPCDGAVMSCQLLDS